MNTTVNIEKEILKRTNRTKNELQGDTAVSEIKGLLEYKTLEDKFIINNLGINSVTAKMEENVGKFLIMEKIEKATDHTVVNVSDIRSLCMKYKLRFLPTKNFIGNITPDVVQAVKKLEAKKKEVKPNFSFDAHALQADFYILAPGEMFKLESRPKEPKKMMDWTWLKDPILFYKESDENYVIIKKWGNDFTIARRGLGLLTENYKSLLTILCLGLVAFFGLAFVFLGSLIKANLFESIAALVVLFGVAILCVPESKSDFYTQNNWNKNYKN